jgi:phosphoribosyl 1,2-cyclic phosphodiesterase
MTYGGNTTCIQVLIDGVDELLIFDAGTGFRNLGNQLQSSGSSLKGRVFITHPHWDHLQGFPFFKPFYIEDNWFRIYLPPQGEMGCKEVLQGHMSSTFFPVSIDMLEADLQFETFQPGNRLFEHYSVEYMWATHTVPTAIYKITVQDQVIVFCPDNELMCDESRESQKFRKEFKEFIKECDVLIHDAQYNRVSYQQRKGWGHTAWEDISELAVEANVGRLYLTHHDPDKNDDVLAEIDKEVNEKHGSDFTEISLAKEGQEILLSFNKAKKVTAD